MIAFAAPWVLAGLSIAAVPILLHLFARREPPTIEFPAVQYLTDTARISQHRLTLQHLLLLMVRTLLIVVLVLAAAGPTLPGRGGGAMNHAPAALVLVFDNSLSSGVTENGFPVIDRLRDAGRRVLARASSQDALWLITADGITRRGTSEELRQVLDSLTPLPTRLDLGEAISIARDVLSGESRPGEVMVVSDLQETALGAASGSGPLFIARPETPTVPNLGLASVDPGTQPWIVTAVRVMITANGDADQRRPVSVVLQDPHTSSVFVPAAATSQPSQGLLATGAALAVPLRVSGTGWKRLTVGLAPDELRLDDVREVAVRIAPPARVVWDPTDEFLDAASQVLVDAGRLERWVGGRVGTGPRVTLGDLGPGPSIVFPPRDPARLGALNRGLAARGVSWRFGALVRNPAMTDSTDMLGRHRVTMRHALEATGLEDGVLLTVDGSPWLVRSGSVVLIGSRLDTSWTDLPVSAPFVPLIDLLANRLVAGELAMLDASPGDRVLLPDAIEVVARRDQRHPVEGGAAFTPRETGVHYLLVGADTVGALNVNPDPRESLLDRGPDRMIRDLWPDAGIVSLDRAAEVAFTMGVRADLRGPLLWLAAGLAVVEVLLAAGRRRGRA